mmetsp:Transcript_31395/g.110515  ORF Transcript_31395/g.110515 Transcript_31395/m.110515 type:complete len:325 (-) Transcript_31395:168-1142(-)
MEEHEALPRPARLVARREVVLPRAQRTPAHLRAEARRLARPRGCLFGTVPAARARGSRAMRRLRLGRHRRHARRARRRPRRRRRRPTPRQNRRPQPHLVRRCRVGRLRRRPRLRAAGRLAPRPRGAGRGFGGRCRGLHESRRRAHALVPRGVARRLSRLACAQRVCKGVQIQGSFVCRRNPRCGVCAVDFVLFAAAVGGRGARLCARELRRRRRPRLGPGALALRLWPIRYGSQQGSAPTERGKMEKSYLNFRQNYPEWVDDDAGATAFLENVKAAHDDSVHRSTVLEPRRPPRPPPREAPFDMGLSFEWLDQYAGKRGQGQIV